jgi:hypothetical protein
MFCNLMKLPLQDVGCHNCYELCSCSFFTRPGCYSLGFEFLPLFMFIKQAELIALTV